MTNYDPNGSCYIVTTGSQDINIDAVISITNIKKRPGDVGPILRSGTKGYDVRQAHINEFMKTDCQWILMLDHDMIFEPDTLEKLRNHGKPFVTGYYMRRDTRMIYSVWFENFEPSDEWPMANYLQEPPRDELVPLGASGWGVMLMHRDVIERTRTVLKGEPEIIEDDLDVWPYDLAAVMRGEEQIKPLRVDKRSVIGSDIRFPFYAKAAGFQLWGDASVRPKHITTYALSCDDFSGQALATVANMEAMRKAAVAEKGRGQQAKGGVAMTVNVVVSENGHILPRMARQLEPLGWTVSEQPDPGADLNYYMSYLQVGKGEVNTKTASWFTHYESYNEQKCYWWDKAADYIDQPLVTSPLYLDMLPNSKKIVPGVDRAHFRPLSNRPMSKTPKVGIVGVGSIRKGPDLIALLYYGQIPMELTITGSNWPFYRDHQYVEAGMMPQFYDSIDMFLCTSTIEGVPMPVLEALACGKRSVIPSNVGICDELPEMPGLRHYQRGNFPDMLRAIRLCLADDANPDDLRGVTDNYTLDHWRQSHAGALDAIL